MKAMVRWIGILTACVSMATGAAAAEPTVSLPVPPSLAALVEANQAEVDLPEQFSFLIEGRPVPGVLEDACNLPGSHPARAAWPVPEETGVLFAPTPTGPGLRFTSGYLACAPAPAFALGDRWTFAAWVRVDDPDWGMTIRRDSRVPVRRQEPVILAVGAAPTPDWCLRLSQQRPLVEIGAWRAWGPAPLALGKWTHLAVVRDGGQVRLYRDGRLEPLAPAPSPEGAPAPESALPPAPAAPVAGEPATLRVGGYPLSEDHPGRWSARIGDKFIGALGDFCLDNSVWTDGEVAGRAALGREQAERLSLRFSVLDDPTVGTRSRIAQRREESAEAFRRRAEWWRAAKFGLFMHWGPSTLIKQEISWSRGTGPGQTPPEVYDNLYKQFNPVKYDPQLWAKQILAAGMKYAVLITKHHDGFCEWPTQTNEYNIAFTPYGQDVVGKYVAAMREAGVRPGIYFSGADWWYEEKTERDKGREEMLRIRNDYARDQLRELLSNYGPIAVLWFDMWGVYFEGQNELHPDLLINDRGGGGDFATPENFMIEHPVINPNGSDGLWETCSGTGGPWGYASEHPGFDATYTVRHLVEVVAKGGNWLCNVAPRETGELPATHMDMLAQAGDWLRANGESVYGTHRTPLGAQAWGWTTANATTLFLHVFTWPGETLTVSNLHNRATEAYLLQGRQKLPFRQEGDALTLELPAIAPDPVNTVIAVTVEPLPARRVTRLRFLDRARGGEATASAENGEVQGAAKAFDGDLGTKWFNPVAATGWLQYRFPAGEAWAITRYLLTSGGDVPERDPQDWELQGSNDGADWVTLDTRRGEVFTARNETRVYDLVNPAPYAYYRLLVTANRGAPGLQLTEMRLRTAEVVSE